MRAEDLLLYFRATPFRAFRVTLTTGQIYDIRHFDALRVTRTTALFFTLDADGIYDLYDAVGLELVESIQYLDTPTIPPQQGNGQPPTN